ncbi:MAG: type I phosphomannose isomerase catalytic subunit [Phycisphaerae bacterium]
MSHAEQSQPLKFSPRLVPKVWGGRDLAVRGEGDAAALIGESWELSDIPNQESRCRTAEFEGLAPHELGARLGFERMGMGRDRAARFPVLIKLLDIAGRLSVQVHPPHNAAQPGELPKDEVWSVLSAGADARIYLGWRDGVTMEEIEQALGTRAMLSLMNEHSPTAGDQVIIPAGVFHAATGPLQIAEIQASSDTTYRVYDWDQVEETTGQPRTLHLKEARQSLERYDLRIRGAYCRADQLKQALNERPNNVVELGWFRAFDVYVIRDESVATAWRVDQCRILVRIPCAWRNNTNSSEHSSPGNAFENVEVVLLPAGTRWTPTCEQSDRAMLTLGVTVYPPNS